MKIVTALKHLFIPHEHNDYKPHFFREISVASIVVASIFMLGFSAGSSFLIHKTVLGASMSANVLVDLTNESRLAYDEAPLTRSPLLDQAAELKAQDMAEKGYFAHTSPEGIAPWYWFRKVGYTFLYAGENLAINFVDAQAVRDAWLASPKHRENLLDVKFKEIGMATVSGVYENGPSIYVVQMFGTPAKASTASAATTSGELAEAPSAKAVSSQKIGQQVPEVKGESASTTPSATSTKSEQLQQVFTTTDLAIVKNNDTVKPIMQGNNPQTYSKWYERFLFGGSYYVDLAYKILMAVIVTALLTMILIEVRKQHWKHIVYGLALLLVITLCALINQSLF